METSIIIPNDILLEEILVRLPVQQLLRLKCVCKQWYARIGDVDFIKKQYQLQYDKHVADQHDVPRLFEVPYYVPGTECSGIRKQGKFHLLSRNQIGGDFVLKEITGDLVRDTPPALLANHDSPSNRKPLRCMGVVKGIVGLRWGDKHLALWNPATREFKDVGRWSPDKPKGYMFREILGLGFDIQSNDLKILGRIDYNDNGEDVCDFDVYSLRTNSWKRIKKPFISGDSLDTRVFTTMESYSDNGVYYWLIGGSNGSNGSVSPAVHVGVCFDFNTETCKEFNLPKNSECCDCYHLLKIGKYMDGLALFVSHYTSKDEFRNVDIWQVTAFRDDDPDIPLSWQLLSTVTPIQTYSGFWLEGSLLCGDLLVHIDNDHVFGKEGGIYVYNLSTRTIKNLIPGLGYNCNYFESLFPIHKRINF